MHSFERVPLKARGKKLEIRPFTAGMKNAVNLFLSGVPLPDGC